jgi:CyaY protein
MTREDITEQTFERAADETLRALERALADLDTLEVDLQMGILTLEFADGTKYVLNSHRAAKQIWMAAERNAWHFDYHPRDKRWIATKGGEDLRPTLAAVVSRKLGHSVDLSA